MITERVLQTLIIGFDSTLKNLIYFIPNSLILFKDCKEMAN